jgi:hypothetical protein
LILFFFIGIDHPTIELTITPYNGIKYSDGIGGGRFSKLAVKLPNLVTVKMLDVSFEPKPNALLIQSPGESVGIVLMH